MPNPSETPLTDPQIEQLVSFAPAHQPRAYVNSFVRFHHPFTLEQRLQAAKNAGWNVFQFPSELLRGGDLLSDSGTTTLTLEQVSAMLLGDEAYGSNWGYFQLLDQFERTFGFAKDEVEVYLFHQGRAAEHALFSQLGRLQPGGIIPSNGHFDTTRANVEASGMAAVDLFAPELGDRDSGFGDRDSGFGDRDSGFASTGGLNPDARCPMPDARTPNPESRSPIPDPRAFMGDMDLEALHDLLKERAADIPVVCCTITNNTGGGQPVSLANVRAIRQLCDEFQLPFFLDACRFAENSWFVQHREPGCENKSIASIVRETFSLCDGFTISLKKDGLSNMGGALMLRKNSVLVRKHPALLNALRDHQILVEGHPTYGGLSGRDIMVISEGLKTVVTEQYLHSRIRQVHQFGQQLATRGVPVLEPFGGHAIYIDVDQFFVDTALKKGDFGGISLTGLLLLKGIRLCELGAFAFGKFDPVTGLETFPPQNFVRCAIPRNKYEEQDLSFVADCVAELHHQRQKLPRAVPVHGRELSLRHFKARFELVPP